jgi:Galactose oxidase, central domain
MPASLSRALARPVAVGRGLAVIAVVALSLIWTAPAGAGTAMVPTWSTLSPPQAPPGLRYASEAYDADDQTVVLFGGLESNGAVSGSTWIWNGTTWTQAAAQVSGPSPRQGAAMAYSAALHQLILFGGQGADGSLLNDTWAWNGQSWFQEATTQAGSGPDPRQGAALAADSSGDLVLFGGTGASSGVAGSAGAGSAGAASTGSPATDPTTITTPPVTDPPATAGDAATTPTTLAPATDPNATDPAATDPAATDPAATSDPSATGATTSADTSVTDPPTTAAPLTTSPTTTPPDNGPSAVTAAAVTTASTTLDDTWTWDGTDWTASNKQGTPPARTDATLTWDASLGETVLFGGSAAPITSGGGAPLGDTWIWTPDKGWSQLQPAGSPPARYDAVSAAASGISGDIVSGGVGSGGVGNDTWTFDGTTWTPLASEGTLGARSAATASWDDSAGQLVMFGGTGGAGNTLADTVVLTEAAPVTVTPTSGSTPTTSAPATTGRPSTTAPAPTGTTPSSSTTSTPGGTAPATATGGGSTSLPVASSSATTSAGATTTNAATTTSTTDARVPPTGNDTTPVAQSHPATTVTTTPALVAPVQTVHTGSLVTVLGSGFRPGAVITITFHSTPYTVGKAVAGPTGDFSATVTVPETASLGEHHLEATGMSPSGTLNVLLTPLKVVPLSAGSSRTTSHTTLIMVGVAVLLPIGTWLFLSLRSRWHRTPARPAG